MHRTILNALRALVGISLLSLAGCASDLQFNEQVEGTVKLDGMPLSNVLVEFVPNLKSKTQAPVSRATTDSSGHFILMCANERPGAVIGRHNVLVRVGRGGQSGADEMDAPPDRSSGRPAIPSIYGNATKTPLKVEITSDKHSYEINVQSLTSANSKDSEKDKE